jgi:hypothetical protein
VSQIRPLEGNDLGQVVELYERAMRSGRPDPPPGLATYFERTLVDYPWADPEIPSLVYEGGDGRILGFLGSHVRRLRFDDTQIRMGCSGQLVSDPDERRLAVGGKLLRSYLSGPQDLTITDGATDVVREMWVRLGGHVLQPGSIVWTRLMRPFRGVGDQWLERRGRERWRAPARPVFSALDAATARLARPPQPDGGIETEELTVQALLEHQSDVFGEARLRADYDEPFVEWLFGEMAAVRTRGRLVRRLVRRDGALSGWYVAYIEPGGLSQVMQVAATKGAMRTVLDCLFAEAWESGSAGLEGRLEHGLFEPLFRRRCVLRYGTRALFHSRDPELVAAIALGASGLTRLDGEWWMGHHTEPFRGPAGH